MSDPMAAAPDLEDLHGDKLLATSTRMDYSSPNGVVQVPAVGGIPLLRKLGQGGMGAVYYGVHPRLQRPVAVKVLPAALAALKPGMMERFVREARLAAAIKSPHLVAVHDVAEDSHIYYIVMEYVDGCSAGDLIVSIRRRTRPPLSESAALDICMAATKGLAAAHEEEIVHRDIKPDNILIPFGKKDRSLKPIEAMLADLGLGRGHAGGDSTLTGTEMSMGTPGYMAPEQALDAKSAGKPADVFGMGATLYALLATEGPFDLPESTRAILATINAPHPPLRSRRADTSDRVVALLDRCLAKKPKDRPADAAELLKELEACRADGRNKPAFTPNAPAPCPGPAEIPGKAHGRASILPSSPGPALSRIEGRTISPRAPSELWAPQPHRIEGTKNASWMRFRLAALVLAILAGGLFGLWRVLSRQTSEPMPPTGGPAEARIAPQAQNPEAQGRPPVSTRDGSPLEKSSSLVFAEGPWQPYRSKEFGFSMLIPETLRFQPRGFGDGWQGVQATYGATTIEVAHRPPGFPWPPNVLEVVSTVSKTPTASWQIDESGSGEMGWEWYKTFEMEQDKELFFAAAGAGARGNYIVLLRTPAAEYHRLTDRYTEWFNNMGLLSAQDQTQ